ncbi:hypothetical protein ACWEOH_09500 [Agromyces sp. NPDC004153]
MKIGLKQAAAAMMIAGSALFIIGSNLPISGRVFPEPDSAAKLASITDAPGEWTAAQVLFALGPILTTTGVALLSSHARRQSFAPILWTSTGLLAAGTLLWIWVVAARTADPGAFAEGSLPTWPEFLFLVLTEAGLVILGVALLLSSLAAWVGWVVIVVTVLMLVATLVFGDIVPFAPFLVPLLVGVALLLQRAPLTRRRS